MKIIGFVKFYNEEANLDRCLSNLKQYCDEIVICNDSSTDRSVEIAQKYTKDIITLPNEFEKESEHKQKLLEFALQKYPDATWFVTLDPDESLDRPSKVRELCEFGTKNGIDGFFVHLKNLWLSTENYRVDEGFNNLFKIPIWRNNGQLKFDTSPGLHKPQNPINLQRLYYSNLQIIHYGFSTREEIQKKYNTYKEYGQSGWALSRLSPDSKVVLRQAAKSDLKSPKVTVAIPTFIDNDASLNFFIKALFSCNEQTFQDMEILVVDDGSPPPLGENIRNICEVLNARYFRNPENKGIAATRNLCIEFADGDFLFFISADDFLFPRAIETALINFKEDAFYYSDYAIFQNGQVINFECPRFATYEDFKKASVASAKESRMNVNYNMFAKTDLWRKHLFDEGRRKGEDLEHFLRCLLVDKAKFLLIPEILFVYRVSPQMWSSRLSMEGIKENNKATFEKINSLLGEKVF